MLLFIYCTKNHVMWMSLINHYYYFSGRRFQTGKVTVQCLPYKELASHNLHLSSVGYNKYPIITASYLKVLWSVNPGNNPYNNCLFRALPSNIDLRQVFSGIALKNSYYRINIVPD